MGTARSDFLRLMRLSVDHAVDGVFWIEESARFMYVNKAASDSLAYSREELLELSVPDIDPDFSSEVWPGHWERMKRSRRLCFESRHQTREGRIFPVEITAHYIRFVDHEYICAFARDVSARKQTEEELRESEERFRGLTENATDLIAELDAQGRFVYASPNFLDTVGYAAAELIGDDPFGLVHPHDRASLERKLRETMRSGRARRATYRLQHRNGAWIWAESTSSALQMASGERHAVVVTRDITKRREEEEQRRALEERLQQAQKLESLGVLAGGIAHDFNNLLAPIIGHASIALTEIPADSPLRQTLEDIVTAARRASELTDQLLAYAGRPRIISKLVELTGLVREMSHLLATGAAGRARVRYDLAREPLTIEADPTQLRQIVLNLITNASEAVDGAEGSITVRTGFLRTEEPFSVDRSAPDGLPGGSYAFLEVADNGVGMDEMTRAKMFEPFFTTKFTGRGLGLAAVLGIVRAHRGAIRVESEPGRGTVTRVLFPRCGEAVPKETRSSATEQAMLPGTILIIDDEKSVLSVAARILERSGVQTLTAQSGREGTDLFRDRAEEIDAVLLDLTMPGMPGEAVMAEMQRIRPETPVLLMSGYSQEAAQAKLADQKPAGFVHKPFTAQSLIDAIAQARG